MPNNPVLILANSVYQLLTAVHMKTSLLCEKTADLLVTDITPSLQDCLPRLKEAGIFRRVLYGKTRELGQTYGAAKEDKLAEAFAEIPRIFRWALDEELDSYAEVYFSNFDIFLRMLASTSGRECLFFCYEDGFSSYVIDFLREGRAPVNRHPQGNCIREKLRGFLLYEPGLVFQTMPCRKSTHRIKI